MAKRVPPAESEPLAYSVPRLAALTSLSIDTIRAAIKDGELRASWVGTKPIIRRDEANRWLEALPTQSPRERRYWAAVEAGEPHWPPVPRGKDTAES